MNYSDFIYDFNLYLCERFGYRNCCSVMHNANGICVSVNVGEMDLYIRFWEYSCGVGSIPDWSIIAQQLQTEPAGEPERPCPFLQGVRPTLRLQIPLHRG